MGMSGFNTLVQIELRPTSRHVDKSVKKPNLIRSAFIRSRLFYEANEDCSGPKMKSIINHDEIKSVFVIKDGKYQGVSVDDFITLYNSMEEDD